MTAAKSLRISQVGLRGVVGSALTATHVLDFAAAFGTFLEPGGAVVIGRDPRASGVMLREGVIAGLLACGRDVIDLGLAPTPVIQHAIRNRLPNLGAGDLADRIRPAFHVLNVEGGKDVDARVEQFLHILPALGMS